MARQKNTRKNLREALLDRINYVISKMETEKLFEVEQLVTKLEV